MTRLVKSGKIRQELWISAQAGPFADIKNALKLAHKPSLEKAFDWELLSMNGQNIVDCKHAEAYYATLSTQVPLQVNLVRFAFPFLFNSRYHHDCLLSWRKYLCGFLLLLICHHAANDMG